MGKIAFYFCLCLLYNASFALLRQRGQPTFFNNKIEYSSVPHPIAGHHPVDPLILNINEPLVNRKYYALWLFSDNDAYQNTLELSVEGLPESSGIRWIYHRDVEDEYGNTLSFSGTPSYPGRYHVKIKARNLWNYPGTYSQEMQHFTLFVKGETPKITIPPQYYRYHQSLYQDVSSYFYAGKGDRLTDVSADLDSYELILSFNRDKQSVILSGVPSKPTLFERAVRIKVSNQFGDDLNSNFKLNISGPPVKVKEVVSQNFYEGAMVMPINLIDCFVIPYGSDKISKWDVNIKTSQGRVMNKKEVKQYIGLEIKYNRLQGIIREGASQYSPFDIFIVAKNTQGTSIDKEGKSTSLKLKAMIF